jgi:hypothetical protein
MKPIKTLVSLIFSLVVAGAAVTGHAQGNPTATQQLQLSAFAAGTGTFTDYQGGKNLAFTAGADLTYLPFRLLRPSIEIRGTYPIDGGTLSSQKNFLGGVKVEHAFGRFTPYANFLIGRGEIDYYGLNGPTIGNQIFISSTSTVYSPGGGLDYELTPHFEVKVDAQFQHWNSPSGTLHPVSGSVGIVYHFDFNRHSHRGR